MAYIYDIADTWNAIGTTFTAIKMSVTDTASASGSLLMDLQVGGVSQFSVSKAGRVIATALQGTGNSGAMDFNGAGATLSFGGGASGSNRICYGNASGGTERLGLTSTLPFGWSSTSAASETLDTVLRRDAANTLAQRNGVNAQAFNLYNTYTDASNYERGFMRFVSNGLEIGFGAAGTGSTAREVKLAIAVGGAIKAGTTANLADILYATTTQFSLSSNVALLWGSATNAGAGIDLGLQRATAGVVRVTNGSSGGGAMQLTEMTAPAAPATDNVRIYAEDDGAGKTRLMARFATGAAQQIAIEP